MNAFCRTHCFAQTKLSFFVLSLFAILFPIAVDAQSGKALATRILKEHSRQYDLTVSDMVDWVISDEYVSKQSQVKHIYLRQRYQGIEIFDANAGIHLKPNGELLVFHNQFISKIKSKIVRTTAELSAQQAVQSASAEMGYILKEQVTVKSKESRADQKRVLSDGGISRLDIPAKLMYQPGQDGQLHLVWNFSIYEIGGDNWWNMRVDAVTGKILDKNNWVTTCDWENPNLNLEEEDGKETNEHLTGVKSLNNFAGDAYNVFPLPVESPNHGARAIITDPANPGASPFAWHDTDGAAGAEFTITRGNNVWARKGAFSPDGGAILNFDFPFNPALNPTDNLNSAITNLFYWNNIIHDVLYQYGFDETSGSFQQNNYGNGGIGNDFVFANAQAPGNCNANFGTPPDGINGTMNMFTCNMASPARDGDFDNGVIVHEYGHGISNRLTGGPGNSNCLNNAEQMGEGWSDWYALMLSLEPGDLGADSRAIGTYLFGQGPSGSGIRAFPYSTDLTVNPDTYDAIKPFSPSPHRLGSVWCAMIWEVTWALIDQYGFDPDIYFGLGGNNIAMALITEALKLQPCNPGFVDGRDAILAADVALYGGANECLIWNAFAKRGLGFSASQGSAFSRTDGTEAFDLPPGISNPCSATPDFLVSLTPNLKTACAGTDVTYKVNVFGANGFTSPVTLSAANLPGSSTVAFGTNPVTPGNFTDLTISLGAGLAAATYPLSVNGQSGVTIHSADGQVKVPGIPPAPTLNSPGDGATDPSSSIPFSWNSSLDALFYEIEIAKDAGFGTVIDGTMISGFTYQSQLLPTNTTLYWHVRAGNDCGNGSFSTVRTLTIQACGNVFVDSGGPGGPPSNFENITYVLCPEVPGDIVNLQFTIFDIEPNGSACFDFLEVYNGNSINAPFLGQFCGTGLANAPGGGTIAGDNPSGCLTFVYSSDPSVNQEGWEATITCASCILPEISAIQIADESCLGANDGTMTVTTSSLLPLNYILTPSVGSPIINTTGIFTNLSSGTYTVQLQKQGDSGCVSVTQNATIIVDGINPPETTGFEICQGETVPAGQGLTAVCNADCGTGTSFSITPGSAISSTNPVVCKTISVSGISGPVSDVNVHLNITHTWVADLKGTIESPNGTMISLFDLPGGCAQDNMNVTFNDEATTSHSNFNTICNPSTTGPNVPGPPFAMEGEFQPLDGLAGFDGLVANGNWTICISDEFPPTDDGIFENATLTLNAPPPTISWWDAPIGGNQLGVGAVFDPTAIGAVDPNVFGIRSFWAQCECNGCASVRVKTDFEVLQSVPTTTDFSICPDASLPTLPGGAGLTADCGIESSTNTIHFGTPIPDKGPPVCRTMNISGIPGSVSGMKAGLRITHTFVGNLDATLESPSGTSITLFDRPGFPAAAFGCGQDNLNVTFDDAAALTSTDFENSCNASFTGTNVPGPSFAIEGTFQPLMPLSNFDGETINGTWTICITDNVSFDSGKLEDLTLEFDNIMTEVNWWDAPTGGSHVGTGFVFDPILAGVVNPGTPGSTSFWAECQGINCPPTQRAEAVFTVQETLFTNCPSDINQNNDTGLCQSLVNWTHPSASNNCPGAVLSVSYAAGNPAPANLPVGGMVGLGGLATETFAVGQTVVSYALTDLGNNTITNCSFLVTIFDNVPPVALCQDAVVQLYSNGTENLSAEAFDNGSNDVCSSIASMSLTPNVVTCADLGDNAVTLTVTDAYGNSASCTAMVTVVNNGSITSISVSNMSGCDDNGTPFDPSDDTFTADVTMTFVNQPDRGQLVLSGDGSAVIGAEGLSSQHTFTQVAMPADGGPIELFGTFSLNTACLFTNGNAGTAPAPCSPPATGCSLTGIHTSNVSACNNNGTPNNPDDDFFTADVTVTFVNPPAAGFLNLTGDGTVSVAASNLGFAPTSYTFISVQMSADGNPISLEATFSANPTCTLTNSNAGIAPESCSTVPPDCVITAISTSNNSTCDNNGTPRNSADDTFTADVTVIFNSPPSSGFLNLTGDGMAGVSASGLAGSYTFTGVLMSADGSPIECTATFSASPSCTLTNANAGMAPASCSPPNRTRLGSQSGEGFTLFPNPAQHMVNLDLKQFLGQEVYLAIYNPLGKVFFRQHFEPLEKELVQVDLDSAKFRDGMYFVSVIREGRVQSKRLVVVQAGKIAKP